MTRTLGSLVRYAGIAVAIWLFAAACVGTWWERKRQ